MKTLIHRSILVVALFATTISFAFAQGITFETTSFKDALQKARQENKVLFVDCYTSWCGPCKMMERRIFPNDTVGAFFNRHFISFKMNMETGEGPEYRKKYNVNAYPTLLFIQPETQEIIYQAVGGKNVQGLLDVAREALDPNRNLQGAATKYNKNKLHAPTVLAYLNALKAASLTQKRDSILEEYLTSLPQEQIHQEENWTILSTHTDHPYSMAFDFMFHQQEGFRRLLGAEKINEKMENIYRYAAMKFIFRRRLADSEFPWKEFNTLLNYLQKEKDGDVSYYLSQMGMVACVQKGDYNAMLDVLEKAIKEQNLTEMTRFYFIWLNLTYLKEAQDLQALDRGLKWLEEIKEICNKSEPQQQAWSDLRNTFIEAKKQ